MKIGIAGAGFAGAVLARELAEDGRFQIVVFEERSHVAGNCHTSRETPGGIMVHHYGPHIFHTSRTDVWDYVQRWAKFGPFVNRVKAITARGVFSLPINLLTINQFFGLKLDPSRAEDFVAGLGLSSIEEPSNFEEKALKLLGRELYENFFAGYSRKQWGVEPRELPASTLERLPIRFNYNDNYFDHKFQGIPLDGYTAMVQRILSHPAIEVRLGQRLNPEERQGLDHIFWSGPLDAYFDYEFGRLRYRTLSFERIEGDGDFQGNPLVNYCEESVPYTRIAEYKHFMPWEEHSKTVCFREYSKFCEIGDYPYLPLRFGRDREMLDAYFRRASRKKGVTFIGRLGTYRYLDMNVVIEESLNLARFCRENPSSAWPAFSTPSNDVLVRT